VGGSAVNNRAKTGWKQLVHVVSPTGKKRLENGYNMVKSGVKQART